MPSILFVCTANQFRSPLAAACFLKVIEEERAADAGAWRVESAGTWTEDGLPAAEIALQVARHLRLYGLSGHRTRQISQALLDPYDLIVVMEKGHKEALSTEFPSTRGRLYLLSEIVDEAVYDIPDPGHYGAQAFDVGRDLYSLITRGKENILQLAISLSRLTPP